MKMNLRDLIIERILYATTDEQLESMFDISEDEMTTLSDLDLLELYEEVIIEKFDL